MREEGRGSGSPRWLVVQPRDERLNAPLTVSVVRSSGGEVSALEVRSDGGSSERARPHCLYESESGLVSSLEGEEVGRTQDARGVTTVWRFDTPASRRPRRVIVTYDEEPTTYEAALPLLATAEVGFAMEEGARGSSLSDAERDELETERLLQLEHLGLPAMSLARYAQVTAEMSWGTEREAVLAKNGLTEHEWMVQEVAWMNRIADSAQHGNGQLAEQMASSCVAAQDALAVEQGAVSEEDYHALVVALREADDPTEVLRSRDIGIGKWVQAERTYGGSVPR
jgi:hypothetical protein